MRTYEHLTQLSFTDQVGIPAALAGPTLAGRRPVVVSWGLGVDSSAFFAQVLGDRPSHQWYRGLGFDPANMIVLHAVTGDEWDNSLSDAEAHLLPLFREFGVRLVQVARGGPRDEHGIAVLDDSRAPTKIHKAGPWKLSDELRVSGTVPMVAKGRRVWCVNCTISDHGVS